MDEPTFAENRIAQQVVDSAFMVHSALGPGLLESVYEHCLSHEFGLRNIAVKRQVTLPIHYKGARIDAGFRIDLLVGELVVVEIKAIDRLAPIHQAQLLTYLKVSECRLGLLINVNVRLVKDGVRRLVRST